MERMRDFFAFLKRAWLIWIRVRAWLQESGIRINPADFFEDLADKISDEKSNKYEPDDFTTDGGRVSNIGVSSMPQGIQTNFPHAAIRRSGCYFLAILRWAEITARKHFSNEEILRLYDECVQRGFMETDCFVNNAVGIANLAIGNNIYRDMPRFTHKIDRNLIINRLVKPGLTHFVLVHNNETWDSLDPDRPAALNYRVDQWREFV